MDEQSIIDEIGRVVLSIYDEYTLYVEPGYILTHIINLKYLMGEYFALMGILMDIGGEDAYCTEFEKDKVLLKDVENHISSMCKKLKED